MVFVAEMVAGSMIEKLVEAAYNYIANKVKDRVIRSNMEAELDKLNKVLPKIKAALSAAEKVDVTLDERDDGWTAWMWQLRDAVDAADNLLDDIEYRKLDKEFELEETTGLTEMNLGYESDSKGVKMCCTALASKFTLKNMKPIVKDDPILVSLSKVVKHMDEVGACAGEFVQLVFSEQSAFRTEKRVEIARDRETGFMPIEKILFGRAKEKEELTKWLLSSRSIEESEFGSPVAVLAIVGVGGIGKTSLAQDIYNSENVNEYFSKKIWICVSSAFDVPTILGKIVQSPEQSLSILQEEVKKKLSHEIFLLVLDDVWDDENRVRWENLVVPLQSGKHGSKIILTTRMNSVAKLARDVMEGSKNLQHNLKGLNGQMSALLLDKYAFLGANRANYSNLQSIIMKIVEKLGGVPLLLKAVGGVLNYDLDYAQWMNILNSAAMNLTMNDNKVLNILKLSYQNLPIQIKSCFRFCSIFPEDYHYTEEELVGMWVALGMISQPQNGHEQPENIGKGYFNILVRKPFLIENGKFDNGRRIYVMHDCMYHMASIVSEGECLKVNNINLKEVPKTIWHMFIKYNDISVLANTCPPRNLQTLIIENYYWDQEFPSAMSKFFKGLTNLRVLKIHWSEMHDLPIVNTDLQHLRYVDIYGRFKTLHPIPNCFRKLYHLQVIYLRFVGIEEAFAGEDNPMYSELTKNGAFSKLRKLRHFRIRDYFNHHVWLPAFFGGIGRLTSLQEIGTFTLKEKDGYKLSELENLNNLNSSLNIRGLEIVENYEEAKDARLIDKKYLYSLRLEWISSSLRTRDNCRSESDAQLANFLKPPCNLQELTVQGYAGLTLPCWLKIGYPENLVSLSFIDCDGMSQLPHQCCFRDIKFVELHSLPLVRKMPLLPLSLRKLNITSVGLVSLPMFWLDSESTSSLVSSSLSSLVINDCPNLRSLADGLFQQQNLLIALEVLEIYACRELVRFPDVGFTGLTSLKSLRIQFNQSPEITPSMPDKLFPPSLNRVIISGQVEGVLHNLLKGLTSLSLLHLIELNVISLSQENRSLKFASLEDLKILKCGKMKSLDGLYVGTSLQRLAIEQCSKLEVATFQIEDDQGSSIALKELNISSCDELRSVDNLGGLTSLRKINIGYCPSLSSIITYKIFDNNQGITPSIANNSLAENHSETRKLGELESLIFEHCAELASLSFMVGLKSANSLTISKCPKLLAGVVMDEKRTASVGWRFSEDDDNTLSVNYLNIDCASLLLFNPLRSITSVQHLSVYGCSQLHPLPEFFLLQNRTSITRVTLLNSSDLEFLPSCLQDLPMIRQLCISNAKKLKALPELPHSLQYLAIFGCTSELERLYMKNIGENWNKIAHVSKVRITQDQW